jgi:hypothetical protein
MDLPFTAIAGIIMLDCPAYYSIFISTIPSKIIMVKTTKKHLTGADIVAIM